MINEEKELDTVLGGPKEPIGINMKKKTKKNESLINQSITSVSSKTKHFPPQTQTCQTTGRTIHTSQVTFLLLSPPPPFIQNHTPIPLPSSPLAPQHNPTCLFLRSSESS